MLRIAIALVAAGLSTFATMSRAQNCAPFIDVPAADPFCSNIQWMFNRGVTLGCTPNQYCPANAVRRDQMAAFMFRLSHDVVFQDGGNAFGNPAVLGTTDNNALDVRVNNARVMRYEPNAVSPNVIGGHPANAISAGVRGATIAGGGVATGDTDPDFTSEAPNRVTDIYGSVGGGYANVAGDDAGTAIDRPFATVAGGHRNVASGRHSAIGGGLSNTASGTYGAIAGGIANEAANTHTAIGGGQSNTASGTHSAVGGGAVNTASGDFSFIGSGEGNDATADYAVVVGGHSNEATGLFSAVLGGDLNTAGGDYSVAMGRRAGANGNGSFSFADSNDFDFASSTDNAFRVRATGGVRFVVEITGGGGIGYNCLLTAGNGWNCSSDRNLKQNLVPLDGEVVLEKLATMPVYAWNPAGRNAGIRHYGPTAQDFRATFGLGDDDTMIGMQDADGVALAAIQGLNAKVDSQAREIEAMRASHAAEIAALRQALERVLARER